MSFQQAVHSWSELELQFRQISERAGALASGLDPKLLARRPKQESWSIAECLAHLNLSVDAYFPIWTREFAQARRQDSLESGPYRLDFWGRILVWLVEPPARFRFPAPSNFQPAISVTAEEVLPAFLDRQQRILEILNQGRGVAVDKIKIASPFNQRVHYSIWSSFCVTASHERRHLWQAERAAQALTRL